MKETFMKYLAQYQCKTCWELGFAEEQWIPHCQNERHQAGFPKAHLSNSIQFFISDLDAAL